jgi:hypothetical protein
MPLLVTSAFGVNGDGYGALLAFGHNGTPLGTFCNDPRIADPRGLAVHQHEGLLYLNSGQYRVLALEAGGTVVRDTGPIEGLNPGGGGISARTVGITSACAARAQSQHLRPRSTRPERILSHQESCRFRADLLSVAMGDCFWALGLARWARATTLLSHSLQTTTCSPRAS